MRPNRGKATGGDVICEFEEQAKRTGTDPTGLRRRVMPTILRARETS